MIQLTPHMRIWVAVEPADFRKGIDGLAGLCTQQLRQDPFKGALFVFRNRRATVVTGSMPMAGPRRCIVSMTP